MSIVLYVFQFHVKGVDYVNTTKEVCVDTPQLL